MIPDVALGPILAALVAAAISFLGLIVAKEQKVSEFRQAWIDAVRSDLGTLAASALALRTVKVLFSEEDAEAWKFARVDIVSGNEAMLRLKLRLNPSEIPSAHLINLIEQLEKLLNEAGPVDDDVLLDLERQIVRTAAPILKKEWRRVKRGEPIFWLAKWGALSVLLLAGAVAAFGYLRA